jgi:signal transduction histidine kinase
MLMHFLDSGRDLKFALTASYDPVLVGCSIGAAVLAAYAALGIAEQIRVARGLVARLLWLVSGAVSMGLGIWTMHFTAMLAYRLPIAVRYDELITALSVLPAIGAAAIMLHLITQPKVRSGRIVFGGLLIGGGIGAMHFTGMAAMRLDAEMLYYELRTPLNSVIGFADLLKDEVPGKLNQKQARFATDILASGQCLLALVEGILEMSRLDAGAAALGREQVPIGAVVAERVAAHREAAAALGLTMRVDMAADFGGAELSPGALTRMLDALIDNAIKFNRAGGEVAVSVRRTGDALEIAVGDKGIGIARADLPKLFTPLVQLDAGLARKHGGVGLGLALARRLAELHGGTIEVESEPGKGSTFTLRLPIQERS